MKNILISGANRGLGLELARQLLARGERVFAGCRKPQEAAVLQGLQGDYAVGLVIIQLDVLDDASVAAARTAVAQHTEYLDWLVNNAAVLVRGESLDNFDPAVMQRTFDANVTGVMRVTARFIDLLRRSSGPKLLNISSQAGSLDKAGSGVGSLYSYNGSKAALNIVTRMLAHNLRPDGIVVAAVHPGWVQTDMGGPQSTVPPEDSAAGIIRQFDKLTMKDTNKFFTFRGKEHPW